MPLTFSITAQNILNAIRNLAMTKDIIRDKLFKIPEDTRCYENAKKMSAHSRDHKEKPLDRAVWWIELLLRNPD